MPGSVELIGRRPFCFYPPIVGVEHNEWVLRRITWSGVEVANRKTSQEVFIPRRFLGEVSAIEEPYLIVGLIKELEEKEGAVIPHQRRVIEMPRAVNDSHPSRPLAPASPAAVVGIRSEVGAQSRTGRRVLAWIAAGILACVALALALIVEGAHRRLREGNPTPHSAPARIPNFNPF